MTARAALHALRALDAAIRAAEAAKAVDLAAALTSIRTLALVGLEREAVALLAPSAHAVRRAIARVEAAEEAPPERLRIVEAVDAEDLAARFERLLEDAGGGRRGRPS